MGEAGGRGGHAEIDLSDRKEESTQGLGILKQSSWKRVTFNTSLAHLYLHPTVAINGGRCYIDQSWNTKYFYGGS